MAGRTRRTRHRRRDIENQSLASDEDILHRTRVEHYSSTAQTVSGIATFAGSITLSTQLLIQCPNSRLQALLALASQLFLATPLVLLGVVAVLHGRRGDDPVNWNETSRAFIVAQFLVSGFMLIVAFLLLSCAIYVADASRHEIGRWGLAMLGLILLVVIVALWAINARNRFWRMFIGPREKPPPIRSRRTRDRTGGNSDDESYSAQYLRVFWATLIPQVTIVACLIGFGAKMAATANVQFGCNQS